MIDLPAFLIFIILVYLLCYIPGRIIAQLFPLDNKVRFAISFGISFFIYYLLGFSQYVFYIPWIWEFLFLGVLIIPVCIYLFIKHKIKISTGELKLLSIFFLGFLFLSVIQGLQPYYSGGGSYWDWYEYYLRSRFFFDHLSPFTPIGNTLMPQRMPLYHAATSFFMSILGNEYWVIQPIDSLFNMSALLACFLFVSDFLLPKKKVQTVFILVMSVFLLNMHFVAQSTYPWTKAMTAYYVILGLYFSLRTAKDKKVVYIYMGMAFLAMGHLVHQVSFPYIAAVGAAYLFITLCSRQFLHFLAASLVHLAILISWYGWASITFGGVLTFASAPIVVMTANIPFRTKVDIFIFNTVWSILPVLEKFKWDKVASDRNFFILLYDRVYLYWGATLTTAVSFALSFSLVTYSIHQMKKVLRQKYFRNPLTTNFIVTCLFISAGFLSLWFSDGGGGFAGLMFLPSTLVVISLGIFTIYRLGRSLGNRFIYPFIFFVLMESALTVGTKALVPVYFLDPASNKDIDLQRDLYSIPQYMQYFGFPVHLENYKLKTDNNLVLLYDKFSGLQPIFLAGFILGWIGLVVTLSKSVIILSKED